MDEGLRNEVETCICSVLTSNPLRMTIRDLDKEFGNMVGYAIPYREFGHSSLESYLRSIPHRVMVNGTGYHAEVLVQVSKNSAHIDALVRRQRVAPTKKSARCGLRKNSSMREHVLQLGKRPVHDFSRYELSKNVNGQQKLTSGTPPQNQSTSTKPVQPAVPPNIPSLMALPSITPPCVKAKPLLRPVSQTAANTNNGVISKAVKQSPVPNYIRGRLKQIIVKHPEGLHCNRLPDLYKNRFGHELNFFDYGYKSIVQLCMDLKCIFTYQRLKDSTVKVFDKDLGVEVEHEPLELVQVPWSTPNKNTEPALPDGVEKVLLEFHQKHLTEDVVTDASIVRQWLGADVTIEDYIDIVVSEVHDPSKFWIQLRQHMAALDQLMDEMQVFYRHKQSEYEIPPYAIIDQMYLVCIFDGEYHRAKVMDIANKKEGTVKVYYIDYGTFAVVKICGLRYLVKKFTALPAQAIRARLYGIQPSMRDSPWPQVASSTFLNWVRNKELVGQVYDIDEKEMIVDLIIADTSNPERDFFINDALVFEELASFSYEDAREPKSRNCEPVVPDVHLYPTHEELEAGLAPTYEALLHCQAANFSYDRIFPKYFRAVGQSESGAEELSVSKENGSLLSGDEENVQKTFESDTQKDESTDAERSFGEGSSVVSEPEVITTMRPPPGLHLPVVTTGNNNNNMPISPELLNTLANSLYYGNLLANQAMLREMLMPYPYNQNYYQPYPYPNQYGYDPNFYNPMPPYQPHPYPPSYNPYDSPFYPAYSPYSTQQPSAPPPNCQNSHHDSGHLNYMPPTDQTQNNSIFSKTIITREYPVIKGPQKPIENRQTHTASDQLQNNFLFCKKIVTTEYPIWETPQKTMETQQITTASQTVNEALVMDNKKETIIENLTNELGVLKFLPMNVSANEINSSSTEKEEIVEIPVVIPNRDTTQNYDDQETIAINDHEEKSAILNEDEKISSSLSFETFSITDEGNLKDDKNTTFCDDLESLIVQNKPQTGSLEVENATETTNDSTTHLEINLPQDPSDAENDFATASTMSPCDNNTATDSGTGESYGSANNEIESKVEDDGLTSCEAAAASGDDREESHSKVAGNASGSTNEKRVNLARICGTDIHTITMCDNKKYLTLQEVSLRLFRSLRLGLLRHKLALSPYLVDIEGIDLDSDPQLKAELAANGLIEGAVCKVDVFPIVQLPDIVKAVYDNTPTAEYKDFARGLSDFMELGS